MKSSLVRPSGQRRPCAPAAQNRLRCSGRGSNHPVKCPYRLLGCEDGSHGYEHLTYLQDAREVEGLVAEWAVEVQVLSSAPRVGTRSQGRVPAFSGSVGGFPGSEADLECSGNLAHDQLAGSSRRTSRTVELHADPGPGALRGLRLDPARPVPRRRRSHGAAADHALLGSSQDRNVRVLRNGRVVKRGLRLLSVNGRWTWAPRRHGTYVVRWTSRVVAHARSVTC